MARLASPDERLLAPRLRRWLRPYHMPSTTGALVVAGLVLTVPHPAAAADPGPLHVASFDLRTAPGLAANKPEPARPSWRTSFGSEFRSGGRRTLSTLAIDADIVLLQGLTSMREVRRLFPARDWKLVVSRQLLTSDDPLDPWSRDAVASRPVTAIAVRYQQGVRVIGQDHTMELAAHDASAPAGAAPPAATAVRLNVQGKTVWAVSVALTPGCAADAGCPARAALEHWRQARRSEGDVTIAGGGLEGAAAGSVCSGQTITADPPPPGAADVRSTNELHTIAGCLARFDAAR